MRRRLWLNFHFWTISLVAILSIANGALALRPINAPLANVDQSILKTVQLLSDTPTREPASDQSLALKTTLIGCEDSLRLRVLAHVRHVRLQLDTCPENSPSPSETVLNIENKTNGFEATLFGNAESRVAEAEMMDGTFTSAEIKPRSPASVTQGPISTDYISLAPGDNTIVIHRSDRDQTLKIERK